MKTFGFKEHNAEKHAYGDLKSLPFPHFLILDNSILLICKLLSKLFNNIDITP